MSGTPPADSNALARACHLTMMMMTMNITTSYDSLDMPTCKVGFYWCTGAVLAGCPFLHHQ